MKLSIITINKNNAVGLERTCQSVTWQTFEDFEWIVIDGASDDNSVDIIRKYAHKMAYWVSESDTGVYNAMNKGINLAKGDYCLFLNSGDWLFSPYILKIVFTRIADIEADIFYGDYLFPDFTIWKVPEKLTMDFFYTSGSISHQNALIKRSLFFEHGFYDENFATISDAIFFMKELWLYHSKFHFINTKISINDNFVLSFVLHESSSQEEKHEMKKIMGDIEYNALVKRNAVKKRNIVKKIIKYLLPYGVVRIFQEYILNR